MWIFTPLGFYSVVYKPEEAKKFAGNEKLLTVRGRTRADMEALQQHIHGLVLHEVENSDYRYRTYMDREDFAVFMSTLVFSMNYSNFKNEVMLWQGRERETAYHEVWAVMARLQEREGMEAVDDSQLSFWPDEYLDEYPEPVASSDIDWEQITRDFSDWEALK